jgi:hypothetical protein
MRFVERNHTPTAQASFLVGGGCQTASQRQERRQQIKSDTPDHAAPIALALSHHSLCDQIITLISSLLYQPDLLSSAVPPPTLSHLLLLQHDVTLTPAASRPHFR